MRLLLLPFLLSAFAKTPVKEKLNCSAKELERQDCHLRGGAFDLRLLAKTVAWSDGTWHTVDPMPLGGEALEWERAGFRLLNGRPILQIWLWDKGAGETHVQSLHWFSGEFVNQKLEILQEAIVRKRHPEEVDPAPKKPKYLYDGWEAHYLRAGPSGTLEWQASGQKKIIPKR